MISIPFTVSNNELFGYIFNADRLVTYQPQNNLLTSLTPTVRKWNDIGTKPNDYVDDTLVNGEIVCPYIVEILQVGFQYLNWNFPQRESLYPTFLCDYSYFYFPRYLCE